jgi:hypothetical protein
MWHVVVELDGLASADVEELDRARQRYGDFSIGRDTERQRTWVSFVVGRRDLNAARPIKRAQRIGVAVGTAGRASRVTFTTDSRLAEEQAWPDFIGVREAAEMLSVSPQRVAELSASDSSFPTNGIEISSGRVWPRASIARYAAARHPRRSWWTRRAS